MADRGSDRYGPRGGDYRNSGRGGGLAREGAYRSRGHDWDEDGRGFFERASDEVRSWFGDDHAERRRDHGRHDQDYRGANSRGPQGRDDGPPTGWSGDDRFMGGFGNQTRGDLSGRRDYPYTPSEPRGRESGPAFGGGRDYRREGSQHDPHYAAWRDRQVEQLDRDYEDYHRERQSRFEEDFSSWRMQREEQRKRLRDVSEGMEVVGSDGGHVGTVDKVRGDHVILNRKDENAGGVHHSVPCSWIAGVDKKVTLDRDAAQAMDEWRAEDRSRALYEPEDSGSEGPHILNRSFPGTY